MRKVFGKSFTYVDELYYKVTKEKKFGEGTGLNDCESLKLLQDLHNMQGELYIITDYCYEKKCGPFVINAKLIKEFVETFYLTYGETFYSTDIVIINFEEMLIWVLFHEGICWLSKA